MSPAVSNPDDQRGFCRNAFSIVLQMQPGNEKYVPIKISWVSVGFLYGPGFMLAALRSGSRALARVTLSLLALAKLTMCV